MDGIILCNVVDESKLIIFNKGIIGRIEKYRY